MQFPHQHLVYSLALPFRGSRVFDWCFPFLCVDFVLLLCSFLFLPIFCLSGIPFDITGMFLLRFIFCRTTTNVFHFVFCFFSSRNTCLYYVCVWLFFFFFLPLSVVSRCTRSWCSCATCTGKTPDFSRNFPGSCCRPCFASSRRPFRLPKPFDWRQRLYCRFGRTAPAASSDRYGDVNIRPVGRKKTIERTNERTNERTTERT